MRIRPALLLLFVYLFIFTACDTSPSAESTASQATPSMRASDDALKEMRTRLNQATLVMGDVLRDREAVQALYKAIELRDGDGYDENVSFAHMLADDTKLAKAYTNIREPFASAFNRALSKAAAKSGNSFTANGLRNFLIGSGTIVRLPYHDRFKNQNGDLPVVVAHPLTPEAEMASPDLTVDGIRPVANKSGEFETVPVNKSLAMEEPSYIIAPCDQLQVEGALQKAKSSATTYCGGGGGFIGGGGGGDDSGSGDDITSDDEFGAFLDWMQCREDTDSIFSGGPDYRVFIYEPDITSYPVDPLDDTYDNYFEVNQFSGNDCDDNDWEQVGTNWDSNWQKIDEENGFLVYDWDRLDGTTINYDVGYDGEIQGIQVDASASGSFDINNNAPLFNIKMNRDAFASNNGSSCRNLGTKDGNCIRGGGSSLRFTLGANKIN
jgi:hypothetical protein